MDLIVIIPDDYLVPIDEDVEEEDLFDNEDPTTILYLSLTKVIITQLLYAYN